MRMGMICWLSIITSVALAGEPHEGVYAGVKVTFDSGAETNPTGIIEVVKVCLAAINRQDVDTVASCFHEKQRERVKSLFSKELAGREYYLESINVYRGNYRMDGNKMYDQLKAKIHTTGPGGKGGASLLMLFSDNKWVFVLD